MTDASNTGERTATLSAAAQFRGLDHVAIAVRDADAAIDYWTGTMGFELSGDEVADDPGVRLVYLSHPGQDVCVQVIQPVRDDAAAAVWLREHGEGLHHICVRADDIAQFAEAVPGEPAPALFRAGRRRSACFLTGEPNGVKIEVTETHPSR